MNADSLRDYLALADSAVESAERNLRRQQELLVRLQANGEVVEEVQPLLGQCRQILDFRIRDRNRLRGRYLNYASISSAPTPGQGMNIQR